MESLSKTAPAQGFSSGVSAETQLERLRERISLVGRAAKVGIWEYDFELNQLLVDMLRYAAADLAETKLDVVDIEELIGDAVATIDHGHCRIVVHSDVSSPVSVAATPLGTCVRNLVDNACKHHDKPIGTVEVTASQDGNHWLQIEVADDGPGIPPWIQEKLYQPFKTSDRERVSGLGLAHVRTAVDKHNGSIEVVTGPSDGTTFTIRWPIANPTSS